MKLFETTAAMLGAWTGSVAGAIIAGLERVVSPRVVRLIEGEDGSFAVEAAGKKADNVPPRIAFADGKLSAPHLASLFRGSRVEIVLRPKRFLLRPLELPARAADFIEGIAQSCLADLPELLGAEQCTDGGLERVGCPHGVGHNSSPLAVSSRYWCSAISASLHVPESHEWPVRPLDHYARWQ